MIISSLLNAKSGTLYCILLKSVPWFNCRVENLRKFKGEESEDPVPALVCTDLAARGLDLVVDHVINFDFPLNPVSRPQHFHHFSYAAHVDNSVQIPLLMIDSF